MQQLRCDVTQQYVAITWHVSYECGDYATVTQAEFSICQIEGFIASENLLCDFKTSSVL
jgi:hypothetical protein